MPHSLAMSSQCAPIDLPVRGSATPGKSGFNSDNLKPLNAANFCPRLLPAAAFSKRARSALPYTIGTSEVVSEPPPMPASICPVAIFPAMWISVSNEVPQARCRVMPGVSGDSPDDSAASRPRFQSDECLITAPIATSPNGCPCRPNFSTSAPNVRTESPKLPTSAYAVFCRQKGMRTPPSTATGRPYCMTHLKDAPARRA